MKTNSAPSLDRLVDSLGDCLRPEAARRVVKLNADRKVQARVDYLAEKCSNGELTESEQAEYGNYVS